MTDVTEIEHCYIGRAGCGCVVAVAVDATYDLGAMVRTAECVAEFIRDGLTIERIPAETFRAKGFPFGHKCGKGRHDR